MIPLRNYSLLSVYCDQKYCSRVFFSVGSYSDVAVLFGLYQLNDYKEPLEQMIAQHFNIKTQTVLELERDGDNGGVVLDSVANTMSFESMCVVIFHLFKQFNFRFGLSSKYKFMGFIARVKNSTCP